MEMTHNFLRFKPIAFHGYPASVMGVIAYSNNNSLPRTEQEIIRAKYDLILRFLAAGIKAYNDTRIVFECEYGSSRIYIGFYEGGMSIGLGVTREY